MALSAMEFWEQVGSTRAKEVVAEAGTKWSYYKHIAHGRKTPSIRLARRLVAASGGLMSVDSLIPANHHDTKAQGCGAS